MFLFSYSAAVIGVVCLFLSAAILMKKHDRLSVFLVVYIFGVGLWNVANSFADVSWNENIARLWCGLALIGSMIFMVFYVVFLEQFLNQRAFKNRRSMLLVCLPAVLFSFFAFTKYYIVSVFITGSSIAITVPGNINYFVLIYSLSIFCFGLSRLEKFYKSTPPIKQRQILYVKTGFIINIGAGMIFTIVLPLAGNFLFFSLAPQFTFLSIILTIYAIYRYNLLDLKIIIQRSLVYSILFGGIVLFYLILIFCFQIIFGQSYLKIFELSSIITTLLGIFSVPKIDNYLKRATDRFFYKNKYDFKEALMKLVEAVKKNLGLKDLIDDSLICLNGIYKTKGVYFLLLPEKRIIGYADGKFVERQQNFSKKFEDNVYQPWLKTLALNNKNDLKTKESLWKKILESAKIHYDIELIEPLINDNNLIGAIVLKEKLSGEEYTKEDKNLLHAFSAQVTMAIVKAKLYQEVSDYSKNLEKKVEERTIKIKKMQESQSNSLLDLAHAIQTPLTILKGELDLLQKNNIAAPKMQQLGKTVDNLSQFVTKMLKLAKMDFANPHYKQMNLSQFLIDLSEDFLIIAEADQIDFQTKIEPNIFIKGDEHALAELTTNLVSNAVKYIANERKIKLELKKQNNSAIMTIIDSGIGIKSEDLPKLFNRFYRAKNAKQQGTGLGLSICQKIVEMHNGKINVKSEFDKGTTIFVSLPII